MSGMLMSFKFQFLEFYVYSIFVDRFCMIKVGREYEIVVLCYCV